MVCVQEAPMEGAHHLNVIYKYRLTYFRMNPFSSGVIQQEVQDGTWDCYVSKAALLMGLTGGM